MTINMGKFIKILITAFITSLCIGSAYATTSDDDLVAAIKEADLAGMKLALQQGANPNVSVCEPAGIFLPSKDEKCAKSKVGDKLYSLIWATEMVSRADFPRENPRYSNTQSLLMLKLLASAGALSSVFYVDSKTGEVVSPNNFPGVIENILERTGRGGAERALVMVKAGYLPSEKILGNMNQYLSILQGNIVLLRSKGFNMDKEELATAERKLFLEVMTNKDVVGAVTEKDAINAINRVSCKLEFEKSGTIEEYRYFIETFKKNDFCNLVPQANIKLSALVDQAKQREAQEKQLQLQEQKEEAARTKMEAVQQAKERQQLAVFRKKVVEGDETNCGPVIESKGKLLKISFAVANYGNEHWIRRDEIFPSGYGCRFMNGQYQSPQ